MAAALLPLGAQAGTLGALAAQQPTASTPGQTKFDTASVDWLLSVRDVASMTVHPKDRLAIVEVASYRNDKRFKELFLLDLTGKKPAQLLTAPGEIETQPAFSPDGSHYALLAVKDGVAQLVVRQLASTAVVFAARYPRSIEEFTWGHDGASILFAFKQTKECSENCHLQPVETSQVHASDTLPLRRWDSWVERDRSVLAKVNLANGEVHRVTNARSDAPPFAVHGSRDFAVSSDGKYMAWAESDGDKSDVMWGTDTHITLLTLATGEQTRVSVSKGYDRTPRFTNDNKSLVWLSMQRAGYESDRNELHVYDIDTKQRRALTPGWDMTVQDFVVAPDGSSVLATVDDRGGNTLYKIALKGSAAPERVLFAPSINLLAVEGSNAWLSLRSLTTGGAVSSLSLTQKRTAGRDAAAVKLLDFNDNLSLLNTPQAESITVKTKDHSVQAWVVRPAGWKKGQKTPVFVLLHGGPQVAATLSFSTRWNPILWAARGYTVIEPNFRGSPGFGQAYTDKLSRHWSDAYEDVMAVVDSEIAAGHIDGDKMCAGGASYGGYLTDWVATRTDRFKCLISHAGPYNLESQWGATEELFFSDFEHGLPWQDRTVYEQQSPHRFVDRIKTPMLLTHGELDYRVPYTNSLELFSALQRRGVKSRLVVFSNENHWILNASNKRRWFNEMFTWIDAHLANSPIQ